MLCSFLFLCFVDLRESQIWFIYAAADIADGSPGQPAQRAPTNALSIYMR